MAAVRLCMRRVGNGQCVCRRHCWSDLVSVYRVLKAYAGGPARQMGDGEQARCMQFSKVHDQEKEKWPLVGGLDG